MTDGRDSANMEERMEFEPAERLADIDERVELKIKTLSAEQLEIVRRGAEIIKSGGLVACAAYTRRRAARRTTR